MSFNSSHTAMGAAQSPKRGVGARLVFLLSTLLLAVGFLTATPVSSTDVSAATASSKSKSASSKKYYKKGKRYYKKRKYRSAKRKYGKRKYAKRKYSKRKYAKRKYGKRKYSKRKYAKRKYGKRKYSKRKYAKRKYGKRKYAKRSYKKRRYAKRKYSSKKRYKKRYAKASKRPKIGWKGGRYGYSNKKSKSKKVRVAALGKPTYRTRKKKSLSGGGVRWVASSKCLNGRLKALVYKIAASYGSVTVSSTCRSRGRNARVGGAKRSKHLTGSAVDFRVHGSWGKAWAFIKRAGGVGGYKHYGGGLFHVDTGPRRTW